MIVRSTVADMEIHQVPCSAVPGTGQLCNGFPSFVQHRSTPPNMILRYALFAGSLSLHVGVKAQYWNQRANLPDTTYAPYGFSVGDRVFMGSGVRSLSLIHI